MSKISPVLAPHCQTRWNMSSSASSHLGHSGVSTKPARYRRSWVQHDAVAAASSMPRAACKPLLSKNLSCLNNVVRSAPLSKPAPSSCLAAFSHNCPSIEARKACQNPQSSIPTPPALRVHLLPSGSFQDVCRMGTQLCCMSVTMTADMCPRTYLHLVAGLLAIIAVAIFAQTFPSNVGPESVIVLPKDKPLPNEISRDLNCWVGIGMQEVCSV